MREDAQIVILLAAYNGKAYVGQMIDSVLAQDTDCWHLIVSDDGDGTEEVLETYARRYPQKITHYRAGKRFGNAKEHFWHLLQTFGDAPYVMFCDQDDVWHSDKVRKTWELMQKTETAQRLPTLVHTDLHVVDADLSELAPSFLRYAKLDGGRTALSQLLVQNVVTGCTVMINRPLAQLACAAPMQQEMLMHDWWLALLAAGCGRIGFLDEATIDYRQHGDNSVGAKDAGSLAYVKGRVQEGNMADALRLTMRQAAAFAACYQSRLPKDAYDCAAAYGALTERGKLSRWIAYGRGGYWKCGWMRRVGQLLWG
jgi:hypothetical protein